jgi:hypothetical protein
MNSNHEHELSVYDFIYTNADTCNLRFSHLYAVYCPIAKVKNEESNTSTPAVHLYHMHRNNFTLLHFTNIFYSS